jgi:hypothetical protein
MHSMSAGAASRAGRLCTTSGRLSTTDLLRVLPDLTVLIDVMRQQNVQRSASNKFLNVSDLNFLDAGHQLTPGLRDL